MAQEQYANAAQSTLASGINNSVTTVPVVDGSSFPAVGNYRIKIDTELLLVTARSVNDLTVTRAIEGTVAASHSGGAAVIHDLTAASLKALATNLVQTGAFGSIPAAGQAGNLFLPNDGQALYRDTGGLWKPWGPIFPMVTPEVAASWTWVNQGGSTLTDYGDMVFLEIPSGAGDNIRGAVRNLVNPTNYTITAMIQPYWSGEAFARQGIGLYDGTKIITLWWDSASSTTNRFIVVQEWTNVTTFAGQPATGADYYSNADFTFGTGGPVLLRIRDDGSTLHFEFSTDYQKWWTVSTLGNTAFMTPTKAGIFCNGFNSSKKNGVALQSWDEI